MRTQEESTPFNPDSEKGDDWETELDCDSKASQYGLNDVPKPHVSLPYEQDRKGPINAPENKIRSIVFGVRRLQSAVVSICNFRIVKIVWILYLVFLVPPVLSRREPVTTPDFITLARLQSRLEQVMKDSASSSKVAARIKTSEITLRDLGTAVKYSALSKKDILERDIKSFVHDAKITGASLQQFGSCVWGAVDQIISLNEHTLLILESTPTSGDGNEGSQNWWGERGGEAASQVPDPKDIENIWRQGIDRLAKTLHKLIHEAQHNMGFLQRLEERLNNIADMVAEEEYDILGKERERELGTKLKKKWIRGLFGLNNVEWHSHSLSHALLEMVKNDRQRALNHVEGVLYKLNQMSSDLEDLREGVKTPLIISGSFNIPIEKHIKYIRDATERLVNGQTRIREIEDEYRREKFSE